MAARAELAAPSDDASSSPAKQMPTKLFVCHLPKNWFEADLTEYFSKFGTVDSTYVQIDKATGESKKWGFVYMSNQEEADKAIAALNNVAFFPGAKGRAQVTLASQKSNTRVRLLLSPIGLLMDEKDVRSSLTAFVPPDKIWEVSIMRNGDTRVSRGAAYVVVPDRFIADHLVNNVSDRVMLPGATRRLKITISESDAADERTLADTGIETPFPVLIQDLDTPEVAVAIAGLPAEWNEADLFKVCEPFGNLTRTQLIYDSRNITIGVGFIFFKSKESALMANTALNGLQVSMTRLVTSL